MEMLRRNLKRSSSPLRPLSTFALSASPRSKAAVAATPQKEEEQENMPPPPIHPNVHKKTAAAAAAKESNDSELVVAPLHPRNPSSDSSSSSAKVVVRVRPSAGSGGGGAVLDSKDLWFVHSISPTSLAVADRTFTFDSVLGPRVSQEDVFNLVGVPLVEDSLAGFNTSLICYGQSGTGKTYTMWGPLSAMLLQDTQQPQQQQQQGIVPRVFETIFSEIRRRQENSQEKQTSCQCRCSFVEIYNEQVNDLLDPTHRDLQIRDNASNGIHVENLSDEYVSTVEDVNQILMKGLSNRKVGATSMNLKSSRSHVIFTCIIESWSKGFSSNCFSSSRTSRITFVDLAGPDNGELDGVGKHCVREERNVQKSLSRLGKLVSVLSDTADSRKDEKFPYKDSRLTHLLQDIVGGNSKVTFLCTIASEHRCKSGTLSTLRFGERARLVQNKAVINEITEDDVNGLSDQIRQLKEELIRTKSGDNAACKTGHFSAQNARTSLHHLRVSLNRSLILPHVEVDPEEEMDADEEDVRELCSQISKLHSSSEDTLDFLDAESSPCDTPPSKGNSIISEEEDEPIIDIEEDRHEVSTLVSTDAIDSSTKSIVTCQDVADNANADQGQGSVRKSSLSVIPCEQSALPIQDPTLCSSPKIQSKTWKSIVSQGQSAEKLTVSDCAATDTTMVEASRKSGVRSSLQSSKLSPTESLAASLHRGLHIIEYHQQKPDPRRSFVGLSFDHFALNALQSSAKVSSAVQALPTEHGGAYSILCSSCKQPMDTKNNTEMQIVVAKGATTDASLKDDRTVTSTREEELEALCEEQAAKIKQLSILVEQYKQGSEDGVSPLKEITEEGGRTGKECDDDSKASLSVNEKEALVSEIQNLRDQLKQYTDGSTNDCLLEQIRHGNEEQEIGGEELEKERQKWMEAESRWISLTEELRIDLESNRMLAEKTEMELSTEKKCTAELDDALQRAIYGHARMVEHYAELQEMYNELLEKHRRVMEGISEVKRAALKAGRKGRGTAFAAALSAELSTLRIDREKERAYLKEQNRRLRIQLRDTAEAVHAAGEVLVRLREAEEASTQAQERSAGMQRENEKLKKQMEKMKKKHEMEMETMKHYLAESRLPESALGPLYQHHESHGEELDGHGACEEDQSWRAAFTAAYQ